jgi:flagellar protein FlbD
MITLTRLSGSVFVLNSDLIERIDQTPDSVVTLIDGKKYVVSESLEDIIDRVRAYRGEVVAFGSQLAERRDQTSDPEPAAAAHGSPGNHDRPTIVPLVRPHGEA